MGLPWIDIVECVDPDPQLVMWQFPPQQGQFKKGAQVIVRENQTALVLSHGVASAIYGPGRHTLPSENVPILDQLKGWKSGSTDLLPRTSMTFSLWSPASSRT